MDRRIPVFFVCSLLAAVLAPFAEFGEDDFRLVAGGVSAIYFLLACLVTLDWLSRRGRARSAQDAPEQPRRP